MNFSVFACTLSFVLFLLYRLKTDSFVTFHVLNIFLWNQLLHLFHLLEEVGVVVLFRSLRTETRAIITMEEVKITCRGRRAWGRPCPPSRCSSWRSSWPTSSSPSSRPRSPGTSLIYLLLSGCWNLNDNLFVQLFIAHRNDQRYSRVLSHKRHRDDFRLRKLLYLKVLFWMYSKEYTLVLSCKLVVDYDE